VTTAPLPPNADVVVTQLDFNTEAPTLAEAITSAVEMLKAVPDLTAASLSVPAQPNGEDGDQGGKPGEPAVATAEAPTTQRRISPGLGCYAGS
jgi:hypothetical protein